jgi:hypothetical protein
MKRYRAISLATLLVGFGCSSREPSPGVVLDELSADRPSGNFRLVAHNPLFNRGMNAALTLFEDERSERTFIYVGNRTDGSSRCGIGDPRRASNIDGCPHSNPGILILDATDADEPVVVGAIPPPLNALCKLKDLRDPTGQTVLGPCEPKGVTTRELRVWPRAKLLINMSFRCSSLLHACPPPLSRPADWPKDASGQFLPFPDGNTQYPFDFRFFDLSDPIHPRLISSFVPVSKAGNPVEPHEMFLWVSAPSHKARQRALLFVSTPETSTDRTRPNLVVYDLTDVPSGAPPTEIAEGNWNDRFPGTSQANYPFDATSPDGCGPYDCNLFVHSMGVKPDGSVAYLALEAGHFLALDTRDVVAAHAGSGVLSLTDKLLTDPVNRPIWEQSPADPAAVPGVFPDGCARTVTSPSGAVLAKECPNGHSAVQVPGRHLALTTDEIYGTFTSDEFGCRWGWMRTIDVSDVTHPVIRGEYMIPQDEPAFCGSVGDSAVAEQFRSFSSHNPTVLRNLALIAWHAGGMQAIDIADASHPAQAGSFRPTPIPVVATEDPGLSQGPATTVAELENPDVTNPDFQNKVVFWSYPIIKNGLIYVIDVRNGLFVLKFRGRHHGEVDQIRFLEGNSNLGDARRLDRGDDDDDQF